MLTAVNGDAVSAGSGPGTGGVTGGLVTGRGRLHGAGGPLSWLLPSVSSSACPGEAGRSGLLVVSVLVPSPDAPRPSDPLTVEIADMLRRIEANYGREGSGPGSRFEGRLLEDVQAEAVLRRVREWGQR